MSEAQIKAADDLRSLLSEVGPPPESQEEFNGELLVVLQRGSRSIGVGARGGLWMRVCHGGEWHRLAHESNSEVLELAAGFLITAD